MIHVLVPYDFSPLAAHALTFATQLSSHYSHLKITVIHVVEIPLGTGVGTFGGGLDPMPDVQHQLFIKELLEQREKDLNELKNSYASFPFQLETRLSTGNIFRELSMAIEELTPDLIIMGSSGASGWEEALIGSNTEKIVRTSPCPVLTIKGEVYPKNMKKIVFASNFSEEDSNLASRIKHMQHLFDAQLYFVKITTPSNFENSKASRKRLQRFIQKYKFEGIISEIYNATSEDEGIIEYAEEVKADLIAMSTHGYTGIIHLLSGSIAEDVVNHSKRPIWTLKTSKPVLKASNL
ncbi:MAG: hypothetical protein RL407_1671 [Bacteroidota bacterium]|jgi:nucleotide-binding universal stress UspA family protein